MRYTLVLIRRSDGSVQYVDNNNDLVQLQQTFNEISNTGDKGYVWDTAAGQIIVTWTKQ